MWLQAVLINAASQDQAFLQYQEDVETWVIRFPPERKAAECSWLEMT